MLHGPETVEADAIGQHCLIDHVAIGAVLGIMLTWYLSKVGFSYPGMEQMAERFNLPDRMYPSLSFTSIMLGPSVVFLFSLLASVYPAIRLFFLQPIAAMRAV